MNKEPSDRSNNSMPIMMAWMSRMLPSCEEASELTSQAMDETLPFIKRLSLKLHLMICIWCRRNAGQLQLISRLVKVEVQPAEPTTGLTAEARARIASALKQADDLS